jgi:hypothetical protein
MMCCRNKQASVRQPQAESRNAHGPAADERLALTYHHILGYDSEPAPLPP